MKQSWVRPQSSVSLRNQLPPGVGMSSAEPFSSLRELGLGSQRLPDEEVGSANLSPFESRLTAHLLCDPCDPLCPNFSEPQL